MRNFRRMPDPGLSTEAGPGHGRTVEVAAGITGDHPATMIVLSQNGAHMEPLIPQYEPGKSESRVIRTTGQHSASRVHKAGR